MSVQGLGLDVAASEVGEVVIAAGAVSLDSFKLDVTTASEACAKAVSSYYEAVLAYKPFNAWAVSEDAVAADAACPMARVLAADYAFCRGDAAAAKAHLAAIQAAGSRTWREERYLEAWKLWVEAGDVAGCYSVLLAVVKRHPEDLFALKRGQIMGLILGDGAKILAVAEAAAAGLPAGAAAPLFFHGMWTFGLEQEGRYEEAEAKAREGLALPGQLAEDAWLDHGLAHALYFQGDDRLDEALEFMLARSSRWSASALHPFLYTHNWWHLSLIYCEKREVDEALRIFDARLWAEEDAAMRADPQVQLNALNLLWRLATRGASAAIGGRWAAVLTACEGITLPSAGATSAPAQHCDLLLDVLLVRGLCALGPSATTRLDAFLEAAEKHAAGMRAGTGEGSTARGDAYAVLVKAVASMFRRDQGEASLPAREAAARKEIRDLKPWSALGGSEEQRGVMLEAAEGPVVCGEPERNFTNLFF